MPFNNLNEKRLPGSCDVRLASEPATSGLATSDIAIGDIAICDDEKRVVRQFVEALLFEKLVDFTFEDSTFTAEIKNMTLRAKGRYSFFSRVRLDDNTLRLNNRPLTLKDVARIIRCLPYDDIKRTKLFDELVHTLTLCQWNRDNVAPVISRRALSHIRLESALFEGHPYHPCFKSRSGFSVKDHEAYGPECGKTFKLQWLAIKHAFLATQYNGESEQSFWKRELGTSTFKLLCDLMREKGISSSHFGLLPIHPWQWNYVKASLIQPLTNGDVFWLGEAGDDYQASISLRTLLNTSNVNKASIKLPLNVVNTSSLRTVEPHSVCTAPHLSNWLHDLIENDAWLQKRKVLSIQKEYAGIVVVKPDSGDTVDEGDKQHWAATLSPSLSAIFRDASVLNEPGVHTVPFAALAATERDGKPFVARWIEKYGVDVWLDALINTAIIPVWHLLAFHGIAVEAHAQNMSLVLRDGLPTKVILRDFHESLEYVPDFLNNHATAPDFNSIHGDYVNAPANHYYWMDNTEALRELFVDTVFVYNLTELSTLFALHNYCDETHFWSKVYAAIASYNNSGVTTTARLNKINLFEKSIITESLLKKKLSANKALDEFHHTIDNPLATFFEHACGESHA